MTNRHFLLGLTVTSVCMALTNMVLCRIPAMAPWCALAWMSLGIFFVLTGLMFRYAKSAALSPNKNKFTSAVLAITTIKLMVTVGLLLAWVVLEKPTSALFVLPVLMIYVGFTIFEVYVLLKLSRTPPPQISNDE